MAKTENLTIECDMKVYTNLHLVSGKAYKRIQWCNTGIKRLSFLYDNDKIYTAGAIKNVNFNTNDVDGKACIEYSSETQGVCHVYREDLAAICIVYEDDTTISQKLMDNVVFGGQEVRMVQKSRKTLPTKTGE